MQITCNYVYKLTLLLSIARSAFEVS